jgi:hypothetical protein
MRGNTMKTKLFVSAIMLTFATNAAFAQSISGSQPGDSKYAMAGGSISGTQPGASKYSQVSTAPNPVCTTSCNSSNQTQGNTSSSADNSQSQASQSNPSSNSNSSQSGNNIDPSIQQSGNTVSQSGNTVHGGDASSSANGNQSANNSSASTGASTSGASNGSNSNGANTNGSDTLTGGNVSGGNSSNKNTLNGGPTSSSAAGGAGGQGGTGGSSNQGQGQGQGQSSNNAVKGGAQSNKTTLGNVGSTSGSSASNGGNTTGSSADNSGGNSSTNVDASDRSTSVNKSSVLVIPEQPAVPMSVSPATNIAVTADPQCGPYQRVISTPVYGLFFGITHTAKKQIDHDDTLADPTPDALNSQWGGRAIYSTVVVNLAGARSISLGGGGSSGWGQGNTGTSSSMTAQVTHIQMRVCRLITERQPVVFIAPTPAPVVPVEHHIFHKHTVNNCPKIK